MRWLFLGFFLLHPLAARAGELVYVKSRGVVDLEHFTCAEVKSSTFLTRICHDEANSYLVIELRDEWLHYCAVDRTIIEAFLNAPSAARYYNSNIRSGPFSCRNKRVPDYE